MRAFLVLVVVAFVVSSIPALADPGKDESGRGGRGGDGDDDRIEAAESDDDEYDEDDRDEDEGLLGVVRDVLAGAPAAKKEKKSPAQKPAPEPVDPEPELAEPPEPATRMPTIPIASDGWRGPPAVLLLAGLAVAGAVGIAALRARREPAPSRAVVASDAESFAAGRALAIRQPDPLAHMASLGLGRPEVLEDGPRGGMVVVRGPPPDAGCGFRAGYLAGAVGGEVREVSHGAEACEFEVRR